MHKSPTNTPRRRLSGNARIAWLLWLLSLAGACAIIIAAATGAHASALEPVTVIIHPPATFMLGAVAMSATALLLAVVAIVLAATARHPRGGI